MIFKSKGEAIWKRIKTIKAAWSIAMEGVMQAVQAPVKGKCLSRVQWGALAGTLIGVICIVITGQLGYVSALCGVVMGVCALRGYQMLGKQ